MADYSTIKPFQVDRPHPVIVAGPQKGRRVSGAKTSLGSG